MRINMVEKKKIDLQKSREVIARINEVPDKTLSMYEFVSMYFNELYQSGKPLKELHQFLLNNGIDVGTYKAFQREYNNIRQACGKQRQN
jgi:hypothetical protein